MTVEPISFEKRFWQVRMQLLIRLSLKHTSATSLTMAVVISTAYGFHRTVRFSPFATLNSKKTRRSTSRTNSSVNTAYESTEKTLMELSLFQTFINTKIRTQIQKSALSSSWVMETALETIESMKSS
jgi:hypothetical protein